MKKILFYLFVLFIISPSFAQNKSNSTVTSRHFYSKGGFCSNSIIINSNQTYTQEGGCEGTSNVEFGRWIQVNDSTLQLWPNDLEIVNSITFRSDSIKQDCKSVRFRVSDITGSPIYSFDITFYKQKLKTSNSNNWLIRNPLYDGQQTFETDENGFLEVNYSSFDSVEFSGLSPYQQKKIKYSLMSMEGKTVMLKTNANGIAFVYPEIKFNRREKSTIVYLRKKSLAIKYENETWELEED